MSGSGRSRSGEIFPYILIFFAGSHVPMIVTKERMPHRTGILCKDPGSIHQIDMNSLCLQRIGASRDEALEAGLFLVGAGSNVVHYRLDME